MMNRPRTADRPKISCDWVPDRFQVRYKTISELLKDYDPSKIENRLTNVKFTGPNNLYNHRVPVVDFPHEIGIGEPSGLRTLDIRYITRGKSGDIVKRRNFYPGEIGWSVDYFGDLYLRSSSFKRPDSNYIPR